MNNEMKNVKLNFNKDGEFTSIECSQEVAHDFLTKMHSTNRCQYDTMHNKAEKGMTKEAFLQACDKVTDDKSERLRKEYREKTRARRTAGRISSWTNYEIMHLAENKNNPKVWKDAVMKRHSKIAVQVMKSKINTQNLENLGKNTKKLIKKSLSKLSRKS